MKEFKKIKKKQLALSTLVALACVGHIGYAADSATATTPTTTTTENGVTNNYWDITINNVKEDSGLELGSNARARGNGSIATGTGSLAVGNNAVATGGNETKDTITGKLNENRQRLAEISTAQNAVTNLANEIQKIRAEQAKTIEAGERVKQVRLAKEKARQSYLDKQNAYNTEVANSAEFLRNAQAKLDDLNNRLGAVNRLGGVDINSEDGLTAAATNLKRMTEEGSTLDLPLDTFYKEYIRAHYRAMGDLRNNEITWAYKFPKENVMISSSLSKTLNPNDVSINYVIYNQNIGILDGIYVYGGININDQTKRFDIGSYNSRAILINNLPPIRYKDIKTAITTEEEYNKITENLDNYRTSIRNTILKINDPFFTENKRDELLNMSLKVLDLYYSTNVITYYQKKYEDTNNTIWLDKKNVEIKNLKSILPEISLIPISRDIRENENAWYKKNVTDVLEKNKITTNKLTSDLEAALQINKNAVAEKEKQIAALKASADQAKTNWESINPNASDLLYMEQYEALMRQLTAKSQELQQNQERLTALKNALTLHDLTNVGENAMAIGTNSLSTGSNSIAIGTGTIVTGEGSIAVGKGSAVTGTKSIAVGVGHIVIGNNAGTFGDPNTIYGDNSYAFGNNNTIGDATTTHTVGTNTFVLGSNVTTKANNSVVLGKDSTATEDNVVSIGSATSTRKLINVTDGTVAENSKEAINGNQLWKVSEAKDGAINKTAWQAALGTGTVTDGNTGLVTGGTVNTAITNAVNNATSSINNGLDSKFNAKANTALDNITDDGKTVIRNLSKEAVKLENGTNTSVESRTDGNSTIYKVNVSNDAITGAITPKITELSNTVDTKLATKANKDASNISTEDASKWSEKLGTGTVSDGNTGLVTGGTVNTAITNAVNTATSNVNNGIETKLNGKANTSLDNITDDGKTVIRNLSKEAVKLENGTNTSVESRTDGNSTIYKVNVSNDAITGAITPKITELSNAVDTKLATKANKDASNISTDDASKWSEKLGTGTVTDGNTGLVTGGTVNTAITNAVNNATSSINNGLDTKFNAKANTALDNITDDGKTVIRNLSKEAVKLENGTNTSVESRTDGNSTIYKVNVSNDAITGAIAPKITELSTAVDTKLSTKANKDASNLSTEDAKKWSEKLGTGTAKAGDKGLVTGDTLHTALANVQIDPSTLTSKANTNASNLTAENVKEWSAKLGTGTVGQGESSNGLVNGKSVYEAIQNYSPKGLIKTDGKTVTVDRAGTATHVDFRGTDEHGNSILRDITGVVTNPNDPTSVVNMDTLQTQSQGLEQKLTKDINVGTATASALAALHPLDFDESNKVSFAVSHGQYNGAKATAFGGFVRPNENIMLSLASTISPNDRAWNAGLSFKIGSGSTHKKVNQNEFEALRNKNDKLENELNQLKDQLSKLSTRLSPKRASFPDVPKDHWAKEAVETLHGNDVLDGYPDGEFKGDKQMTRYEYAQMLYKGLK